MSESEMCLLPEFCIGNGPKAEDTSHLYIDMFGMPKNSKNRRLKKRQCNRKTRMIKQKTCYG